MKSNDIWFGLCYVHYILHSNFELAIKKELKAHKIKKIQLLEINKDTVYYVSLFVQKNLEPNDICINFNKFYSVNQKRRLTVLLKKEDV